MLLEAEAAGVQPQLVQRLDLRQLGPEDQQMLQPVLVATLERVNPALVQRMAQEIATRTPTILERCHELDAAFERAPDAAEHFARGQLSIFDADKLLVDRFGLLLLSGSTGSITSAQSGENP